MGRGPLILYASNRSPHFIVQKWGRSSCHGKGAIDIIRQQPLSPFYSAKMGEEFFLKEGSH
jgi:hypothetical protein